MLRIVANTKKKLLTVRLDPEVHKDYKIAAKLRGGTMSNLVHMYLVRVVREEKERNPEAFIKLNGRNEYERPVVKAKLTRSRAKAKQAKG